MQIIPILIMNNAFAGLARDISRSESLDTFEELQRCSKTALTKGHVEVHALIEQDSFTIQALLQRTLATTADNDLVLVCYSGLVLPSRTGLVLAANNTTWTQGDDTQANEFTSLPLRFFDEIDKKRRILLLIDTERPLAADLQSHGYKPLQSAPSQKTTLGQGLRIIAAAGPPSPDSIHGTLMERFVAAIAGGEDRDRLTVLELVQRMGAAPASYAAEVFAKDPSSSDMLFRPESLLYDDDQALLTYSRMSEAQRACLLQLCPVYLLNSRFLFTNWNQAFEDFVAKPLGLVRGQYAGRFLEKLQNWKTKNGVDAHSRSLFRKARTKAEELEEKECEASGQIPSWLPKVDTEPFEFLSKDYGLIIFQKMATQIREENGEFNSWAVALNVSYVQRPELFWPRLEALAKDTLLWSSYADCYDKIIGTYPGYQQLVKQVVDNVGMAQEVLDVGAGTGNATIALLQSAGDAEASRRVTAIEINTEMIDRARRKLGKLAAESESTNPKLARMFRDNTVLYQGDAASILDYYVLRTKVGGDKSLPLFDACVMVNVLFVLPNPIAYLKAIFGVLRPGGVLSLSTPRSGTSIKRLFEDNIKQYHKAQADWGSRSRLYEAAYSRNKEFEPLATKDSLRTVLYNIRSAGFVFDENSDVVDGVYHDCVVVVKAIKPQARPA